MYPCWYVYSVSETAGSDERRHTLSLEDDGHDKPVNSENTSHDNGYNRLEDQLGLQHAHARDANTTLGRSVGSAEIYSCG